MIIIDKFLNLFPRYAQNMNVTLSSSSMIFHKSNCKHLVHKIHDTWHNEYLFCIKCKRTLWGNYKGKRIWASLDRPMLETEK